MITAGSTLTTARIPLAELRVHEIQKRYPQRLTHYLELLALHPAADPGVIVVKPREGGYEILDGHHRFCALIMAGRPTALCLIVEEPQ